LKKTISALVYSNVWISTGATTFCWFYYLLTAVDVNYSVLAFLFFSTLLTYTYQRFVKIHHKEMIHGPRMIWMQNNLQFVKIIMIAGIAGTIWFSLYLELMSYIILSLMAVISFLYAYKFNLMSRRTNLRDIPGVKIYLIGIVWSLACAILPHFESNFQSSNIGLISIGFFLFIVGITIPFDIRDVDLDETSKKTIPQLMGTFPSKVLSIVILVVSYFMLHYPTYDNWNLAIPFSGAIILLLFSDKKRDELFFSFILDGLLIFVPCGYYLLQSL
jgi:hypothetical protein